MFRVVSRAAKLNGLNRETRIILAFDCVARILTGLIMNKKVFIGTDSGATTTKLCAVWDNGEPVSNKVLQRSTNSEERPRRRHRLLDCGRQRLSCAE